MPGFLLALSAVAVLGKLPLCNINSLAISRRDSNPVCRHYSRVGFSRAHCIILGWGVHQLSSRLRCHTVRRYRTLSPHKKARYSRCFTGPINPKRGKGQVRSSALTSARRDRLSGFQNHHRNRDIAFGTK